MKDFPWPPYPPMEGQAVDALPEGSQWQYEPKWDGFRCLLFRDGGVVELQSKACRPLARYFPDVEAAVRAVDARRFVLDGELIVPLDGGVSFEELQLRLHPAASRVRMLADAHPARFMAFDLLADEDDVLAPRPLAERRAALERFAARRLEPETMLALSPAARAVAVARSWLAGAQPGLDGVIAKRLDLPYLSGTRGGMQKVKRLRTIDCVVGGFRYASRGHVVGSLLLGLYDAEGKLHHVGFASNIPLAERPALTRRLEALVASPGFTGDGPGGPSRWRNARTARWSPLRPDLVVEVQYDHTSGGRLRHGAKLLRWRRDKAPSQCTLEQLPAA